MVAEIIARPIAGRFPEKHFGKITADSLWVKFTDDNFQEWVGSFAANRAGYPNSLINFEKQEIIFVIASGTGYLLDVSTQSNIQDTIIEGITTAVKDDSGERIIFSNSYDLRAMNIYGDVSIILNEYFFDEIELLKVENNNLFARYWYYQKSKECFLFQFNLLTKEVKDSF